MDHPAEPAARFAARSALGLVVEVAAGTAFGLLLLLVRLRWGPLQRLDLGVARSLNAGVSPRPALVATLRRLTDLGGPWFVSTLVALAVVLLAVRRRWPDAAYLTTVGLGAHLLSPTLKVLVGRLRPVVAVPVASAGGNSFPSGHALGSTVAYGSLLLVFLPALPARLRPWAVGAVGSVVALVCFTRVALGVHYVSDVVGGVLLGVAWLAVVAKLFRRWRREASSSPPPR